MEFCEGSGNAEEVSYLQVSSAKTNSTYQALYHDQHFRDGETSETIAMQSIWYQILLKVIGKPLLGHQVYHKFPEDQDMETQIANIESTIVKQSGLVKIRLDQSISYRQVPSHKSAQDYEDANRSMDKLKIDHQDSCAGNKTSVATVTQIYNNVKQMVDAFDIFSKCSKSYVPQGKLRKDGVIAVAVELSNKLFSVSFEDVAHYEEDTDGNHKTLTVVVTSRKENVIEGNYDLTVKLRDDHVEFSYTKRQNLAGAALSHLVTTDAYEVMTQQSVDNTILKLAYAGLFGRTAVDFGGCFVEDNHCGHYSTKENGDTCTEDVQCKTGCCKYKRWYHFFLGVAQECGEC